MNNLNSNDFKFKITEWRGYVVRALEDIDKNTVETKERLNRIEKRLNHLQFKMAGIGGAVAVIISVLFRVLLK